MPKTKANASSPSYEQHNKETLLKQEVFNMNCNHENINKSSLTTETLDAEVESITMPPLTVATMRAAIQGFTQVFQIDPREPRKDCVKENKRHPFSQELE